MASTDDRDLEIAPCLRGGPLAEPARELIGAARELGTSQWAATVRAWCVPYVFHGMEAAFDSGKPPAAELATLLRRLTAYLVASAASGFGTLGTPAPARDVESAVERVTGQHYGNLFREFDKASFAGEPARLLSERLTRNSVTLPDLARARVLDAGCGGGRYSVAWHLLGARDVLGVDLSQPGIEDARARALAMKLEGVRFEPADVVDLPLPANSFDIVFSNGVLHHTRDWRTGIDNLLKVLKPGGLGWLYLIESPGGFFWDLIEVLRAILRDDPHEHARQAVAALGIPPNRVFYMLDHVMVPINLRLTTDAITQALVASGARDVRRLTRGADFDRVERIYQKAPFAEDKYGVGEHRFVFSK